MRCGAPSAPGPLWPHTEASGRVCYAAEWQGRQCQCASERGVYYYDYYYGDYCAPSAAASWHISS